MLVACVLVDGQRRAGCQSSINSNISIKLIMTLLKMKITSNTQDCLLESLPTAKSLVPSTSKNVYTVIVVYTIAPLVYSPSCTVLTPQSFQINKRLSNPSVISL